MRNTVRQVGRGAAGGEQVPLGTRAHRVFLKPRPPSPQLPEPNRKIQLLESVLCDRKQTSGVNPNREFSRFEFPFSIFGVPRNAQPTRHCCRVEMAATYSKHTPAVPPTRHWNGGAI
jgi:hypothetical protein